MGRAAGQYDYGRACIMSGRISINGRFWYRSTVFDYVHHNRAHHALAVGQVRDFVVVEYTHKDQAAKRGRVRPSTLGGTIVFVRARQYNPTPTRMATMWLAPKNPAYRLGTEAICVQDLCAFLHVAPERNGRTTHVNLVKVATAMV
jgi:hypothetical protein